VYKNKIPKEEKMRKQIYIILLAMALVAGMSLLKQALPLSNNA
jgi:hypothetical protein